MRHMAAFHPPWSALLSALGAGRRLAGHHDAHRGADARRRFDRDAASQHAGDDVVDDVHAQSRAALAHLGGEEGIEDVAQHLVRHADAVVGEHQLQKAVAQLGGAYRHHAGVAAVEGVGERVVDQVIQHLVPAARIRVERDAVRDLHPHRAVGAAQPRHVGGGGVVHRRQQVEHAALVAGLVDGDLLERGDQQRRLVQRARYQAAGQAYFFQVGVERGAPQRAAVDHLLEFGHAVASDVAASRLLPIGVLSSCAMPATSDPSEAIFSAASSSLCVRRSVSSAALRSRLACSSAAERSSTRLSSSPFKSRSSRLALSSSVRSSSAQMMAAWPSSTSEEDQMATLPTAPSGNTTPATAPCTAPSVWYMAQMRSRSTGLAQNVTSLERLPMRSSAVAPKMRITAWLAVMMRPCWSDTVSGSGVMSNSVLKRASDSDRRSSDCSSCAMRSRSVALIALSERENTSISSPPWSGSGTSAAPCAACFDWPVSASSRRPMPCVKA